jgi:NADPH:quinone reductase-like Zn-dependent oxidoreductase
VTHVVVDPHPEPDANRDWQVGYRPNDPTDMAFLSGLLEAGAITPIVDQVLPLAQAAQALIHFGASGQVGKIVLTMD